MFGGTNKILVWEFPWKLIGSTSKSCKTIQGLHGKVNHLRGFILSRWVGYYTWPYCHIIWLLSPFYWEGCIFFFGGITRPDICCCQYINKVAMFWSCDVRTNLDHFMIIHDDESNIYSLWFIMHHSCLVMHYSQLGFIMSFIRWFIQVFMHSFNPRGRNFLIPCNVIDNCDCIPLNKNALGDVSLPPCPFCVILSILSNSKLKHLITKEFSGNKDIRHLAETSFTNLNHFPYDYSVSNRILEYLKYSKQILGPWTKVFQYVATFFSTMIGTSLNATCTASSSKSLESLGASFQSWVKNDFCSASKPRQHFPTKSPSIS